MMNQPALNFNPPPEPGKLFECDTQLYKIYDLLYHGGATSAEIIKISDSMTYTRRISDIRVKLKPHGYTATATRIPGKRISLYKLEEFKQEGPGTWIKKQH